MRTTIRQHPLVSYFVIAAALSWAYVVFLALIHPPDTLVTKTPEDFGPSSPHFS
jgi:hypothetical protein